MALKGTKILEFTGLAPSPLCGMILSDFGASVTRIDKVNNEFNECTYYSDYSHVSCFQVVNNPIDVLKAGKRTISLNLKNSQAIDIVKRMSRNSDVVIEVRIAIITITQSP